MRQISHFGLVVALSAVLLLLDSCSESAVNGVNNLLDARDLAISERNITAYEELIANDYDAHQKSKADIVKHMQQMFAQFSQLKMESFSRDVYIADDTHARAAQSYRMRVLMNGTWREMLQREELSLIRNDSGWKINDGL